MATAVGRRGGGRARLRAPRLVEAAEHWWRSKWLHLALGVAVAVLTVVFAAERAATGSLAPLDARLLAAGAGTDAALVGVEADQLATVRAVAFGNGIASALAAGDADAVGRLVSPLQANSTVPMVDVVAPDGRVVAAVRSKGAPDPVASRAGLRALTASLRLAHGTRGGRFTELVLFRSGPTVLTISPVASGRQPVGAVLAMTPLADVLGRLSQQVGVDLTAYDGSGRPLATTAARTPKLVDADTARAILSGGAVTTRGLGHGRRETLGRLILDHEAAAVLGVSVADGTAVTWQVIAVFVSLGLVCTVVILATFWARVAIARQRP